jgi:hypothetical protein
MHKAENGHGIVSEPDHILATADRSRPRAGAHTGRRLVARLTEFFEDLSDKP